MTATPVPAATAADLARAALRDDSAEVASYTVAPLGYRVINAVTDELSRVAGVTSDGRPWSAVGKLLRHGTVDPNPTGFQFSASDDPRHWNYWRREVLAYRDGVAGRLAPGLRAPRLLQLEDWGDAARLWLEDVAGTPGSELAHPRVVELARALGHWQGDTALRGARPGAAEWLSDDWMAAFVPAADRVEPQLDPAAPIWSHPIVARHLSADDARLIRQAWQARDALLEAAASCPTTIGHLDVWGANVIDDGTDLVLLDWSSVGFVPLGTDLANLVNDSVWMFQWPVERLRGLDVALTAAYLAGARESGWDGDERLVTGGYAVTVALHFAPLVSGLAVMAYDEERRALSRQNYGIDPDDALDRRAAVVASAVRQIEEALRLPALVSGSPTTGGRSRSVR